MHFGFILVLIRHIERHHKSNPVEVKIRTKVAENNWSTYSDGPDSAEILKMYVGWLVLYCGQISGKS